MSKLMSMTSDLCPIEEESAEPEMNFKRDVFIHKITKSDPEGVERRPSIHSDLECVAEEEDS
jgi:hypothetical protein